jgi:uncharacterized phosphosugar-binding protein
MTSSGSFGEIMRDFLAEVERANENTVAEVADLIISCWSNGGLLYSAGAGHSLAAVNETFYRAGGLAFVRPVHDASLFPLNGANSSTDAEREVGLAADVLARYDLSDDDALVVFSNSGINPYPIELVLGAKERGARVIGVTSILGSLQAPLRAGHRLCEISDVVLDTLVPPGDAAWPIEAPQTGPLSSLANCFVWNLVLVAIHEHAGKNNIEIPTWRSANVGDGNSNARTLERYQQRIPELG